jgi:hypothetical protein
VVTVRCWVCKTQFEVYPSRYRLCKSKRFFCERSCKDRNQIKSSEEKQETKRLCNRRSRDGRYTKRRAWIDGIKLGRGCADCGFRKHPAALQFDHRDPAEKEFSIASGWAFGKERIEREIAKCDVRCANCHAMRTAVMLSPMLKLKKARKRV